MKRRSFRLAFEPDLEREFRDEYFRVFRTHMRVVWGLAWAFWSFGALADPVLYPDVAADLRVVRVVGSVLMLLCIGATFVRRLQTSAIQEITCLGGICVGVGAVIMHSSVPFPSSMTMYVTVLSVAVIASSFVAILRFLYSLVASTAVLMAWVATEFWLAPVPLALAVRLTYTAIALISIGLLCTYITEHYVRENFLQRRALEGQAHAIAEKAAQLELSERRANEANRAKSVFLSNMSHELRTPLNAVLGFAQLIDRSGRLAREDRESLAIIRASGEHLLELINDVLAISKIEAGRITVNAESFDLPRMLAGIEAMIRMRAESKGLTLLVEVAEGTPSVVVGDEGKLRQVLINLLGNAVKFTDNGGLALRVAWKDGSATFEVADTGQGIAGDEVDSIFDAFYQSASGRRATEGTGLGLAICRTYVELMGGKISVTSRVGAGSTFTIQIPLPQGQEGALAAVRSRVVGLERGQPSPRIVVADDIAENRVVLVRTLSRAGLEVREACDGQEAFELWQSWHPHLIWMDMRMPVLGGADATRKIRQCEQDTGEHCCIIALTASAFEHDREEVLSSGCDDFVPKPFRDTTIFEKLEQHLGLRFARQVETSAGSVAPQVALCPERLHDLEEALLRELYDNLSAGDVDACARFAERLKDVDPQLAQEVLRVLRTYQFDELLTSIEMVLGAAAVDELGAEV